MRGTTYHFALYVYYYLLTHAPKEHPFAKQSLSQLTSLLVTIENGLPMYSLAGFTGLNLLAVGRPRMQYGTMPNTSMNLDLIGTEIAVKEAELHGLDFTVENFSLSSVKKVTIERCNGPNLSFLQQASNLQKLNITQSFIEDYSHVNFGSVVYLQIQSSQVGQTFPGKLLKNCSSLETLVLENITISDFSCLQACTNLKHLKLVNVTAAEEPLLEALTKLKKVELLGVSPNLLAMFTKPNQVQEILLKELTNASLQPLVGAQKVESLTIEKCSTLNGHALPTLSALKSLVLRNQEKWVFSHDQPALSGMVASYLQELSGVQHLGGLQVLQLRDNALPLDKLYGLFSLKTVRITNRVACDVDLAPVTSWPMVETLSIRGVLEVSDLSPLASLSQLKELAMNPKVVGKIEVLAQLPNLASVNITGRMVRSVKKLLPNVKVSTCY